MTLAIDSTEASTLGHNSLTSPLTWSFNNTAGNLLVVGVVVGGLAVGTHTGQNAAATAVTYNGVSLTKGGFIAYDNSSDAHTRGEVSLWYLVNPATGSNTVSVSGIFDWTGQVGNQDDILAGAISFSGAGTTTPFGTVATSKNDTTGDTQTTVTISTTAGNILVDVSANGAGAEAVAAGQTLRARLDNSTHTASDNFGMSTKASPGGSSSMTWTIAAADIWGQAGVEIQAASSSTTTLPLLPPRTQYRFVR